MSAIRAYNSVRHLRRGGGAFANDPLANDEEPHPAECNARYELNSTEGPGFNGIFLKARRPIESGDEIFVSYGTGAAREVSDRWVN